MSPAINTYDDHAQEIIILPTDQTDNTAASDNVPDDMNIGEGGPVQEFPVD
ncbi:MAG TPA: hypothetical protein VMY43_11530 [Methanothrix sp.]|nr:hypothetical protein [Methanothrix sp.]